MLNKINQNPPPAPALFPRLNLRSKAKSLSRSCRIGCDDEGVVSVHGYGLAGIIDGCQIVFVDEKLLIRAAELPLVSGAWHVALIPIESFSGRRDGGIAITEITVFETGVSVVSRDAISNAGLNIYPSGASIVCRFQCVGFFGVAEAVVSRVRTNLLDNCRWNS